MAHDSLAKKNQQNILLFSKNRHVWEMVDIESLQADHISLFHEKIQYQSYFFLKKEISFWKKSKNHNHYWRQFIALRAYLHMSRSVTTTSSK